MKFYFEFRNPYENLSREKLEFQNQVVPNCILKKFESMNIKCLCK